MTQTTYSSERERELVEAARYLDYEMSTTLSVDTAVKRLRKALAAYDPPKPKVPVIQPWNALEYEQKVAAVKAFDGGDIESFWNALLDITAKEQG
jgi:hypothetical protein